MYDAADRLALECEVSYTVLGRGAEFVLIDNSAPHDGNQLAFARARGLAYSGIFGLKDGIPRVDCDSPEAVYTMLLASLAFCGVVSDRLRHPEKGDSVGWLRQLYALQDTRCAHA